MRRPSGSPHQIGSDGEGLCLFGLGGVGLFSQVLGLFVFGIFAGRPGQLKFKLDFATLDFMGDRHQRFGWQGHGFAVDLDGVAGPRFQRIGQAAQFGDKVGKPLVHVHVAVVGHLVLLGGGRISNAAPLAATGR